MAGTQDVAQQATKDAYQALKAAVTSLFGRRAERAVEAVEAAPADEAARQRLKEALPATIESDEQVELGPKLTALVQAIKADTEVAKIVETRAHIRLDLDVGGNVTLEAISGAQQIDVRAKADGDFTMRGVEMRSGQVPGNR